MNTQVRPLSLGEILDRTFQFYRKEFVLFVGISAIPQAVALVLRVGLKGLQRSNSTGMALTAIVGVFVVLIASLLATAFSQAATSVAVSEMYLGRKTSIGQAFESIRGRIGTMAGILVGLGVFYFIGFILLIIPGIYMMLIWALAIPAAAIEDLGFAECRDRSKTLTEGAKGRIFVIYVLVVTITYGVLIGMGMILGAVGITTLGRGFQLSFVYQVAEEVITFIGTTLVGPLGMIAFTIAYYDQRVRKEGFDIQYMMQASQQAAAGSGANS